MKQMICVLLACAAALPAWAGDKISVLELDQRIQTLHDTHKSDEDATAKLTDIELTESMSAATLNTLGSLLPGQESREQLKALAVQSAILPSPAAEIPGTPAPDLATQKAILGKFIEFVTKVYMKNPHLVATKVTTYYGNRVKDFHPGDLGYMVGRKVRTSFGSNGTHSMDIESENGVEQAPSPGRENKPGVPESQVSTGPVLSFVLAQAAEGGHLAWQRWELVNGKPTAVFSFAVDKAESRYQVNYCCFAKVEADTKLNSMYYQDEKASLPFKSTVPFHGAFYIDPDTGAVVRLIMQAEFSPSDPVHREDTRIDYGPVNVKGQTLTVPLAAYLQVVLVPRGNNDTLGYAENLRYLGIEYRNYR